MVKVSVIIPCYNLGQYIEEAVESVLSGTYQDFEIIIVNDGSTDEHTNTLLLNYSKPKTRVISTNNQGVSAARNTAIKESKGEYILPLDADDKIELTFLQKAVEVLDNNPEIGFAYSFVRFFGEKEFIWEMDQFDLRTLLIKNCVCGCALFRKKAWEEVNGYNANLSGYMDWDFWISLAEKGWKGYRIPEYLFFYRWRNNSMCRTSNLPENHLRLVKQIYLNHQELHQKHIDYIILKKEKEILDKKEEIFQKEKEILDKKEEILDKQRLIFDLQEQLRIIRSTRIYKTYKKIKHIMQKNKFTNALVNSFKRLI